MINQDTTRAEKIEISISETAREIEDFQLTISKLNNFLYDLPTSEMSSEIKTDILERIDKIDNEIRYREEIKENDEKILQELNCGLNKNK